MTFLFYFFLCLCVILFQSTITPYFRLFDQIYDLLIPFFIYLGMFRSAQNSVPVIIISGLFMDGLTGGPFGLHLTFYIWLYVGIRWLAKIFDVNHSFLVLFALPLAVLFENMIVLSTFFMCQREPTLPEASSRLVFMQALWALLTGPFFMICFDSVHKRWDRWIEKLEDLKNR